MSLHTNIYCATSREETYFDLFRFLYPIGNLDKNVCVESLSEGETGESGEQRGDHFPKTETEHQHPVHNAGRGAEGGERMGSAATPPSTAGRRICDVEPLGVSGGA